MIDGSEKRNRQLAFELQNSHVCEKRSKQSLNLHICMLVGHLKYLINVLIAWTISILAMLTEQRFVTRLQVVFFTRLQRLPEA